MKIEDIIFLMLIIAIIVIALWLLTGSPPEADALISLALFVAASELLIWRNMFSIDKNTSMGFLKVKQDIEKIGAEFNNRFNSLDSKSDEILEKLK
ncbi:MAG: hypothetical protein AABW90_03640 [Nanoarchaeota archaeon]